MEKPERRTVMKLILAIIAVALACVLLAAAIIIKSNAEYTLGKNVKYEDITEVYFTRSSSTNPPYYQRYRIFYENGKCIFYHEKREGDRFPLTEEDITDSGKKELNEAQKTALFDCLKGGRLKKKTETADSGGDGPWVYVYWKGDRSKYREFSFTSYAEQAEFEALCRKLKESR